MDNMRHQVGQATIDSIVELRRLAVDPAWLLANTSRDEIAAEASWLAPRCLDLEPSRLVLTVKSLVVRTAHYTMLVDTCCGNQRFRGEGSPFHMLSTAYLDRLEAAEVDPAEVDFVMCTHLHSDHVGWNMQLDNGRWRPTFPNARYVMAPEELTFWRDAMPRGFGSVGTRTAFVECVEPIVESGRALLLAPEQRFEHPIDETVQLQALPGHTPGHMGLHVRSDGAHALLTGDAFHHPIQFVHPHWGSPADVEADQALATRQDLIATYADTSTLIVPAHFDAGYIVRHGDAARFRFADEAT